MENSKLIQLLNNYRSGLEHYFEVDFFEFESRVCAKFEVKDSMLQPFGLLHGGVTALIGEGVASIYANVLEGGEKACVGQVLNVNHVSSARKGDKILIKLEPLHHGRSTQVWRVDFYKSGKILSSLTMTMAVLDKKN